MDEDKIKEIKQQYALDLDVFASEEVVDLPKIANITAVPVVCDEMSDELKEQYKDVATSVTELALKPTNIEYKKFMQQLIDEDIENSLKTDGKISEKCLLSAMERRAKFQEVERSIVRPLIEENEKKPVEEVFEDIKFVTTKSDNKSFPYNVQIWRKVEDDFVYAGEGKFCRNKEEAARYKAKILKEERGNDIDTSHVILTDKEEDGVKFSCTINGRELSVKFLYEDVPELKDFTAKELGEMVARGLEDWDIFKDYIQREKSKEGKYLYEKPKRFSSDVNLWRDTLAGEILLWEKEEDYFYQQFTYANAMLDNTLTECSKKYTKLNNVNQKYEKHLAKYEIPHKKFHSMIAYSLSRSIKDKEYETVRDNLKTMEWYKLKRKMFWKPFPFGNTIAKVLNKIHDKLDEIRVSLHLSAGTKVNLKKPYGQMDKVERIFVRVQQREKLKELEEESPNIRRKLDGVPDFEKAEKSIWAKESEKMMESVRTKINEKKNDKMFVQEESRIKKIKDKVMHR